MHRSRTMSRGCAALVLMLVAGRGASAQSLGAGNGYPFNAIVLSTGMGTTSVDPLNARMTAAQFATLSNDAVSYGASGYFALERALIGMDVQRSTFGEEGLNNGRTSDLSTLQGMVTVGYAVAATQRFTLFPQFGVGLGRVEVTLRDRNGGSTTASQPTFDEVAQSPGAESNLTARHLLYSVGGGADYLVARRGASMGVVMGVRAGLLASPNRATWTRNGQTIVAGPDAGATGPYLRVVVGIGAR
ncbi:MAG: hypothetical protein ABIP93_15685 [Gemmatimonadaceae bacterium]